MNICGGDCLKDLLENKLQQPFVAFREALSEGPLPATLFDNNFLNERAKFHNITKKDYLKNIKDYCDAVANLKENEKIELWFGQDLFCQINMLVVLAHLEEIKQKINIKINIVNETNGLVLFETKIELSGFLSAYKNLCDRHERGRNRLKICQAGCRLYRKRP